MKRWILIFPVFFLALPLFGQTRLTLFDVREISNQVVAVMTNYSQLINDMTLPVHKGEETERAAQQSEDIASCFQMDSPVRVFYNEKAYVANDIDPKSGIGNALDMTAPEYLKDVCLYIENGVKIHFGAADISSIKQGDFLFVRVRFWSKFANLKNTRTGCPEQVRKAIFRIDDLGNHHWAAFIERITFDDPDNDDIDDTDNNVKTIDSSVTARPITREEVIEAVRRDSIYRAGQVQEKGNMAMDYERKGDSLYVKEQFEDAQLMYNSAKALSPFLTGLNDRIVRNNKALRENAPAVLMGKAEEAERQHRYALAIGYYESVLKKGIGGDSVRQKIAAINGHITMIAVPSNLLQANQPEQAIQECERALKRFNDPENADPELFYIEGKAYEALSAGAENKKVDERILKNYDQAIRKFPAYSDALKARAAFYARAGDLGRAAADFELLCINTDDADPAKPGYYMTKARWENASGNDVNAYADYSRAIHLAARDSFFYERARLSYDRKKNDAAGADLDTAILLNPKNAICYFLRGLNDEQLGKLAKAGDDFFSAELNGIDSTSIAVMESVAEKYFSLAKASMERGDLVAAGREFDQVLLVRRCHAGALHGKATICYRKGIDLVRHKDRKAAADSLAAAIDWNKKALKCHPGMSPAYLLIGLAQRALHEKDEAIASFNDAISYDKNNDEAFEERANTFYDEIKNYNAAASDYLQSITLVGTALSDARKQVNDLRAEGLSMRLSKLYVRYGRALDSAGNDTGAVHAAKIALTIDKNNADAYYYRGVVYEKTNLSKAIDDFSAALELRKDFHFYYELGLTDLHAEKFSAAIDNFTKADLLDTLNEKKQKYYFRGVAHFSFRMFADAQTDFDLYKTTGDHTDDTTFFAMAGMNQLFLDRNSDALSNFNASLALSAQSPLALLGMGFYYAKQGVYQTSLSYFGKAFATGKIKKKDIRYEEEILLEAANSNREFRKGYAVLKKDYFND